MSKEVCGCCGNRIENEELKANYEKSDLPPELWYCEECIKNPIGNVKRIFDKVGNAVSGENANDKRWEETSVSDKAGFVLIQLSKGNINGGTVGTIEHLRAMTASKL